ncbi:hypothetical protein DVJ78_14490 [Humibacter sp. BT305]|uniref:Uncharacterized protein n=2 Tax=Cnuibacter physcomitrellae TaxID=1619308 RepID=A0A1X9LP29_9MICO|nr:hypothetical protein B5808_06400 [Cnuibacter physcomitrellae]AXH36461.1 hypothetical protein DVJ78_14490 [Humibacter sp. BT305]GGI41646.1 hypothetical protein GCM10010988_35060 [Cnuibacter physcomitrellae]
MATATASALRRIREGYWRVSAADGRVLGYVEETRPDGHLRYAASRLVAVSPSIAVLPIGEFHDREDAARALR